MELAIGYIMKEIFSSYSNTDPFNYLFGDKELLARQVARPLWCFKEMPDKTHNFLLPCCSFENYTGSTATKFQFQRYRIVCEGNDASVPAVSLLDRFAIRFRFTPVLVPKRLQFTRFRFRFWCFRFQFSRFHKAMRN